MKKDVINLIIYLFVSIFLYSCAFFFLFLVLLVFVSVLRGLSYESLLSPAFLNFIHFIEPALSFIQFPYSFFVLNAILLLSFVILTKIFLDKKLTKYLNFFFDNFIYPTVFLIITVVLMFHFPYYNDLVNWCVLELTVFYVPLYILGFFRKFIKPIYNNIFLFIISLFIIVYFIYKFYISN